MAIVSMEDLHLDKPREGLSGSAEFSFNGSTGTTDKRDIAIGGRLEWRHARHADFLIARHAKGEALGVENTDRSFLHGRHIWQQHAGLAWEGFLQGERDRFRRLSFRGLVGGGARITLLDRTGQQAAYLGVGAMSERERYTTLAGSTGEETASTTRANLYLVYKIRFRPGVDLVNTLYYQPSLSDRSDYRLLDSLALQVDLTNTLALQLSIDLSRQSYPPVGVEKSEVVYQTGLKWKF